jgi:hypothetical protein
MILSTLEREAIIQKLTATEEGRAKLFASAMEPLRNYYRGEGSRRSSISTELVPLASQFGNEPAAIAFLEFVATWERPQRAKYPGTGPLRYDTDEDRAWTLPRMKTKEGREAVFTYASYVLRKYLEFPRVVAIPDQSEFWSELARDFEDERPASSYLALVNQIEARRSV